MSIHDTFITSLQQAYQHFGIEVPLDILFGLTGHGARITLAMDVTRGKYIGHPSGIYIWDIISVLDACFPAMAIDYTLYIDQRYLGARQTAAQIERTVPSNVTMIDSVAAIPLQSNPTIFCYPEGVWAFESTTKGVHSIDPTNMPFGPVAIVITAMSMPLIGFPKATLHYLATTLERGEEPMEVVGIDGISAVSGWKAYARWIQAYSLPIHEIKHHYISYLPALLHERRTQFVTYLNRLLALDFTPIERDLLESLHAAYVLVVEKLEEMMEVGCNLNTVKDVYFAEQKALPAYKAIAQYLS